MPFYRVSWCLIRSFKFCCFLHNIIFSCIHWFICLQEADAEEVRKKAEFDNKIGIAQSQRDFELKKSGFDMDVNSKVSKTENKRKLYYLKLFCLNLRKCR